MVKAGRSRGLTIWWDGGNRTVWAAMCHKCIAQYLAMIRVGAKGSEHDVVAKAVLEYVGGQIAQGKWKGGSN